MPALWPRNPWSPALAAAAPKRRCSPVPLYLQCHLKEMMQPCPLTAFGAPVSKCCGAQDRDRDRKSDKDKDKDKVRRPDI